jgi:hypothetical protein
VRNNLTTDLSCSDEGVTLDHNIIVKKYTDFFVNYGAKDLHLLANSSAIDAGTPEGAPAIDCDGRGRPAGAGVDVGAYEYDAMKVVLGGKHPARQRFTGTYFGGGLQVQLPAKNGSLGVFDLRGRVVAAVTCSGEDRVLLPLAKGAGQCLLVRFQSGGKNYFIRLYPR